MQYLPVQEELAFAGARTAAYGVNPDIGFAVGRDRDRGYAEGAHYGGSAG